MTELEPQIRERQKDILYLVELLNQYPVFANEILYSFLQSYDRDGNIRAAVWAARREWDL